MDHSAHLPAGLQRSFVQPFERPLLGIRFFHQYVVTVDTAAGKLWIKRRGQGTGPAPSIHRNKTATALSVP